MDGSSLVDQIPDKSTSSVMNFGGQIADVSPLETSLVARRLYWQAYLSLLFYSQSNSFVQALGQIQNLQNLRLFFDDIEKKKRKIGNSLAVQDTILTSFDIFVSWLLQKLQNLQLKQPLNGLNSTLSILRIKKVIFLITNHIFG